MKAAKRRRLREPEEWNPLNGVFVLDEEQWAEFHRVMANPTGPNQRMLDAAKRLDAMVAARSAQPTD